MFANLRQESNYIKITKLIKILSSQLNRKSKCYLIYPNNNQTVEILYIQNYMSNLNNIMLFKTIHIDYNINNRIIKN